MPIPILIAAGIVAAKGAAILKTSALVVKGSAVLGKLCAGKAFLAKPAIHVVSYYGLAKTVAVGVAATMTIGAAAVIHEGARSIKKSIDDGDVAAALKGAADLARKIHGVGGLSDVAAQLDNFIATGGRGSAIIAPTSRMLDALLASLRPRLA
jgi:hypothetical protein